MISFTTFFESIFSLGQSDDYNDYLNSKIKICNQIVLFILFLGVIYGTISFVFNPIISVFPYGAAVISLVCFGLNKWGYYNISRFLAAISPAILCSSYLAMYVPNGGEMIIPLYLALCGFSIIPWVIADFRELEILIPAAAICYGLIIFQPQYNDFLEVPGDIGLFDLPIMIPATYISAILITSISLGVFQNRIIITEKKLKREKEKVEHAYAELKSAQAILIQNEKMASLGLLATGVAHEINNPLNYIQGGIYSLQNICKGNSSTREILVLMQEGVDRASKIVRSLNNLYDDEETDEDQVANINDVLESCLTILGHEWRNKCKIVRIYEPDGILYQGSIKKLHQVFANIILNAIEAIEEYGTVTLTTSADKKNKLFTVSVKDNGKGISKENLPKLFDPFFTTKSDINGTGLGLSNVSKYLKTCGGNIICNSTLGKGAEFIVSLPLSHIEINRNSPLLKVE